MRLPSEQETSELIIAEVVKIPEEAVQAVPKKTSILGKRQGKVRPEKVKLVIELNKVDTLIIKDCNPEAFQYFLKYCYNHNLALELLTVDNVIMLSEMADRFLCQSLMTHIQSFLYRKFSIVYALKIYMWTLKFFSDDTKSLDRFKRMILQAQNFRLIFHQNVFACNCLYLYDD